MDGLLLLTYIIIAAAIIIMFFNKDRIKEITQRADYKYYNSDYYQMTRTPYKNIYKNAGIQGEYLTYKQLQPTLGYKKFVFNVYLPTQKGTTEIDIIMIHTSGIYVIESKNIKGLILGNQTQQQWTQYLSKRNSYSFYNPIKQNHAHIEALKEIIPVLNDELYKSIIVFSPMADLHGIQNESKTRVIKRDDTLRTINELELETPYRLKPEHIDKIQDILLKFTYTTVEQRIKHIQQIRQG